MHLYNLSQELVKGLEQAVQEEKNDSLRQQYQTLLQQQRNATASLKSLGQNTQNQNEGSTQSFDSEFASETYMNANEMNSQNRASQQASSYNSYDNASATNEMNNSQAKASKKDKK